MKHTYTQYTISATTSAGTDAPHPLGIAGQVLNLRGDAGLRIAGWYVQTLRDDGAQFLTAKSLSENRVDVACVSEVCLPGTGYELLQVPGADSANHLYHSGVSDNSGQYGVAIALADKCQAIYSSLPVIGTPDQVIVTLEPIMW
ncbi:unnamed protein product [Dibothriocephalus latus]|uniref:Uncharacterized protein n=1 Tax=Dibothriocephalus latus TaxID=60516 RepID=A0A3P7LGD0_DIBLA|nr:unnamed protein product [Dibothriocephalus latus]